MLKPSIETHNVNGILVAEFWESLRLDPAPVQDLRGHYEAHLKNHGTADVVIDLSGVGFAGSAALGNFVALQRLVRAKGGRIVFCNVDPTVSEVFRASKLDSLFEFAGRSSRRCTSHQRATPHGFAGSKSGRWRPSSTRKVAGSRTKRLGPITT